MSELTTEAANVNIPAILVQDGGQLSYVCEMITEPTHSTSEFRWLGDDMFAEVIIRL
jgi:hypothetical protein